MNFKNRRKDISNKQNKPQATEQGLREQIVKI